MMKARIKFGLIVGGIGLVLNIGVAVLMGICGPFVALIAGAVAGFLAAQKEALRVKKDGAQCGAVAGAIAGALLLIGQVIGGIGSLLLMQFADISTIFGEVPPPTADPTQQFIYYAAGLGMGLCIGLTGVVVAALSGAIAGYLGTSESSKGMPTMQEYP